MVIRPDHGRRILAGVLTKPPIAATTIAKSQKPSRNCGMIIPRAGWYRHRQHPVQNRRRGLLGEAPEPPAEFGQGTIPPTPHEWA